MVNAFSIQKQARLSRDDYSKKGSVDEKIASLVKAINDEDDYCTTSSCSGRIMLYYEGKSKNRTIWVFVSHNPVDASEIRKELEKLRWGQQTAVLWFKFEPLILHISCKGIESAQKMIDMGKQAGFMKSGIMDTKKMVVEIRGADLISAPLKADAESSYIELLVSEANRKMKRNDLKKDAFFSQFSQSVQSFQHV